MEYLLALLIGLSLGLLGGGGSILTVPVLVYVVKLPTKLAVAMSLAVVTITGVFGLLKPIKNKSIHYKIALYFLPAASLATVLSTKLAANISETFQLTLFAVLMIVASYFMIKDKKEIDGVQNQQIKIPHLIATGLAVGFFTGLVGVGGGFMIVPALVLLTGLEMKYAVGTSLFIITINSAIGFMSYIGKLEIPWELLLKFSAAAVLGILIGGQLVDYIPQKKLKKAFGYFLILMGVFVLIKR